MTISRSIFPTAAPLCLSAGCLAACLMMSGCEDSAAAERDQAQQTIADASVELRQATVGSVAVGEDAYDTRLRELQSLVSEVSNLPNAEPGQQAAASMLAAEAHGELASLYALHAKQLQRDHRSQRSDLLQRINAAQRLSAMADAQTDLSINAQRESLQQDRERAEQNLNALEERLATLEGPIDDRTQQNEAAREEARALREEANNLIRRAIELGHANGFDTFQEGVATRRDADAVDYSVALRQLELNYELEPEHSLAEMRSDRTQDLLDSVHTALERFDAIEQALSSDIDTTRQRIAELKTQITDSLQELDASISDTLAEQFDQARNHAEQAAAQAGRAAGRLSGEQGNAARLIEAQAHDMLGRIRAGQAQAASAQQHLLQRMVDAAQAVGDAETYRAMADELAESRDELAEQAAAAFEQASAALQQVRGETAQSVEAFRQSLQRSIDSLRGQPTASTSASRRTSPSADRSTNTTTAAPTGSGFASPQEVAAYMETIEGPEDYDRLFDAVLINSDKARIVTSLMQSMVTVGGAFERALETQFPDASMEDISMNSSFDSVSVSSEDGDTATLTYEGDTMRLVRVDGEWFIDGESVAGSTLPVDQMSIEQVEQMGNAMAQALESLTQRVNDGEFSTIQEAEQALMQALSQMQP